MRGSVQRWSIGVAVGLGLVFVGLEWVPSVNAQTHIAIVGDGAGNVHSLTLTGTSAPVQNWVTNDPVANQGVVVVIATDLDGDGGRDIVAVGSHNGQTRACAHALRLL